MKNSENEKKDQPITLFWWWASCFLLFSFYVEAQKDTAKIKYTPEFQFNDGLYVNFDQVKNNAPLPKTKILSTFDPNDADFFDNLLNSKTLYYYDEFGIKQEINPQKVWGYCKNGSIYVHISQTYNRITVIGSICHFVANITSYNTQTYDPFYGGSYYNNYYPYSMRPSTYATNEMRQFLMDFKTGKIMDFEVKSIEVLLMNDPALYDEYMQLKNRKKQQLKFLYMRKYNERHPLYFPVKPLK
jgi:hypothetical protein